MTNNSPTTDLPQPTELPPKPSFKPTFFSLLAIIPCWLLSPPLSGIPIIAAGIFILVYVCGYSKYLDAAGVVPSTDTDDDEDKRKSNSLLSMDEMYNNPINDWFIGNIYHHDD